MKKWLSVICLALLLSLPCFALAEEAPPPFHADFLEKIDQQQFPLFFQMTIDPDSNEVALFCDETLHEFMIEFGTVDPDGVEFLPEYVVFFAQEITPDMLVVLNTYFSDTVPTLRVSCAEGEVFSEYYLFQSGEDGSILVLDSLF